MSTQKTKIYIEDTVAALAAVWFGMSVTAGCVAAPVLFRMLPKMQAGEIAGVLFAVSEYTGLAIWLAVWLILGNKGAAALTTRRTVSVILLCLAVNRWLVAPVVQALKTDTGNWLSDSVGGLFGVWHGISQTVFLLTAVLSLVCVKRILRFSYR